LDWTTEPHAPDAPPPAAEPPAGSGRVHRPLVVGAVAFALVLLSVGAAVGRLARERIHAAAEQGAHPIALDQHADAALLEARHRAGLATHEVDAVASAARAVARHVERLGAERLDDSPAPIAFEPLTGYQLPGFFSGPHDVVGIAPQPDASPRELGALVWRGLALSPALRTARAQVPLHTRISVWVRGEGLLVHPAVPAETFARWLAPHAGFGPAAISPFDPAESGWLPEAAGPVGRQVRPYVVPLLDDKGTPWAIVRCDVDAGQLLSSVDIDIDENEPMQPVVLDREGRVLAASTGAARVLGLRDDPKFGLEDVRAQLAPLLGDEGFLLPGPQGVQRRGREVLFAGAAVDGVDWTVGVVTARVHAEIAASAIADQTNRATENLALTLLGFSGLFGLLAALAGLGYGLVLRRRLRRLAGAARAQAAGNTDVRASIDGDDEIGAIALAVNASALRAAETVRRLDESRRRLSGLIESMAEGLVITDADDRVTFANARFSEILQRAGSTLHGQFLEELLVPQSLESYRSELVRRREGNSTRFEVTWRNVAGVHPKTLVSALPLFDADGRYSGSCGVVTDITTRARAQEESARAEKLRALGEMAGGVAHDFNNVLTAVLGNTQYLLSDIDDEEVKETLRIIETAALDGTETVNRIRKFTKPSTGVENAGPVDPNNAAHDVLRMARPKFERVAQQRGVRYHVSLQRDARRMIRGNASELREVLLNLAYNALEAMPDGGTLTVETFDRGEDSVGLRISDTGRGIPDDHLDKIFDPFFSTKRGGRCSGLGLSICFGIVRAHGGRIDVRSEPGLGTTLTVVLPAFDESLDTPDVDAPTETPEESRVLLVSSQRRGARMLQRGLILAGVHVAHVEHPRVAADLLADPGIFNTLLVENDLGTHSGWELARTTRRLRPDLRIVLMTDLDSPVDDSQARNAGIDRVLTRPFDAEDVRGVILSALARPPARLATSTESAGGHRTGETPPQLRETWGAGVNGARRAQHQAATLEQIENRPG
jgi:PAS domain S-box-containing protein